MKQPDAKPPIKFPEVQKEQAVDLTPHMLRIKGIINKAVSLCKGEDHAWDAWALRHSAIKGGMLNGIAGLPMATDAYIRGLQAGLKAHIPIMETDEFAKKRLKFAGLIARSAIRFSVVEMVSKSVQTDEQSQKDVLEAMKMAEDGFKRLTELEDPETKPSEHPLVKAQRVMGEKLVDIRTTKNMPNLPEKDREEATRTFGMLQELYKGMFGALFPG